MDELFPQGNYTVGPEGCNRFFGSVGWGEDDGRSFGEEVYGDWGSWVGSSSVVMGPWRV